MPLSDNLAKLRAKAGLTQLAVATRAGLTLRCYHGLEKGEVTDPHIGTLQRLAAAFGVTVYSLTGANPHADQKN